MEHNSDTSIQYSKATRSPIGALMPDSPKVLENFWLKQLSVFENISAHTKAVTQLHIYSPYLPWSYLLECLHLYGWFGGGLPENTFERSPINRERLQLLIKRYKCATDGFYKVWYMWTKDIAAHLCDAIESIRIGQTLGETDKLIMYKELEHLLERLEQECADDATAFRVEHNYTDGFIRLKSDRYPEGSIAVDPWGTMVLLLDPFCLPLWNSYGDVFRKSHRLSHTNMMERVVFFDYQREIIQIKKENDEKISKNIVPGHRKARAY